MKKSKSRALSIFGAVFISLFLLNIVAALPISWFSTPTEAQLSPLLIEACSLSIQPNGTTCIDGEVTLNWTSPAGDVISYKLYRSQEPGFLPDSSSLYKDELNTTGYIDQIDEDGLYFYDPIEGAEHYEIYRYYTTPSGGRASRAISNIHVPYYIDRSRKYDGITYEYKVFIYDQLNRKGPASEMVQVVADLTPPTGTVTLTIEGNTVDRDGSVYLAWTKSSADITGVNIYRSTSSGVPQSSDYLIAENVLGNWYIDNELTDGVFYYRVVPRDEAGNEGTPSNIESVTVNKIEPPVQVLYDPSDALSVKSAFLFKYLMNDTLSQTVDDYVKLTPVSTISTLQDVISNEISIFIYAFHGDEQGILIGGETHSWEEVQDLIAGSPVFRHYFASCYSDSLMTTLSSKQIIGFPGKVDIKKSAIEISGKVAYFIGSEFDETAAQEMIQGIKTYFFADPLDIIHRFFAPEEPLYANVSSYDIDPDAPEYDEQVSLYFQINNETTAYNQIFVESDHNGTLLNYTQSNYTDFNQIGEDSYEFLIPGLPWNTAVHYRIYVNGTDGIWNYTIQNSYVVDDNLKPRFFNAGHSNMGTGASTLWISVHLDDFSANASGINASTLHCNVSKNSGPFIQLTPISYTNDLALFAFANSFNSGDNVTWFFMVSDNAGNQRVEKHYYYRTSGYYWKTDNIDNIPPVIISNVTNPEYKGPGTKMNYLTPLKIQVTADDNSTIVYTGIDFILLEGYIGGSSFPNYVVNFTYNLSIQKWIAESPSLPLGTTFDFRIRVYDGRNNLNVTPFFNFTVADLTPPSIINVTRIPSSSVYYTNSVQVFIQDVIDQYSYIYFVNLSYSTDNGLNWTSNQLYSNATFGNNLNTGLLVGGIPPFPYGTQVIYKIVAADSQTNIRESQLFSYTVGPNFGNVTQSPDRLSVNYTHTVNISVTNAFDPDPGLSSGLKSIILNYTTDGTNWNTADITLLGWGTIAAQSYGTLVQYKIVVEDNAGNRNDSTTFYGYDYNYTVNDTLAPDIGSFENDPANPEYDEDVTITVVAINDWDIKASGVYYAEIEWWINEVPQTAINITDSGWQGTISNTSLNYGDTVKYRIHAVDHAGNHRRTTNKSFFVNDFTDPVIDTLSLERIPASPMYYDDVEIRVDVDDDPADNTCSGLDTVFLRFQNTTEGQWYNVTMTYQASLGKYNGSISQHAWGTTVSYEIWANDTAGNWIETTEGNYYVIGDDISPTYGAVSRDPASVIYTDIVNVSISNVVEEGSGLDELFLWYSINTNSSYVPIDIKTNYYGLIPAQSYGSRVYYKINMTDNAGNGNETSEYYYDVGDDVVPNIQNVQRNVTNPKYYDAVKVTCTVSDPGSGINTTILQYELNSSGTITNVTMTSLGGDSYEEVIPTQVYGTAVVYWIWANDTVGNEAISGNYSYTVGDDVQPEISNISRNISSPDYNDVVMISCNATDPGAGSSGLDIVLLRFQNETGGEYYNTTMSYDSVASTYNASISAHDYGTIIRYKIFANDSEGNSLETTVSSYTVDDFTPPVLGTITRDPVADVYYYDSVNVSIDSVSDDGSGVYSVYIYYKYNVTGSWTSIDINSTLWGEIPQTEYGTTVYFKINATDEAGESVESNEYNYFVDDDVSPSISGVINNPSNPEYDDPVSISATVSDPGTGSAGIDKVLLFHNASGSWVSVEMIHGTGSSYSYSSIAAQSYGTEVWYYVWANDTASNEYSDNNITYTVGDTVNPSITDVSRDKTTPEYNDTVLIWCNATDPGTGSSGIDVVMLKYRNVTAGDFYNVTMTYDAISGTYNQSIPTHAYGTEIRYEIWANDTAGNSYETSISIYTVTDTYAPVLGTIARDPSGTVTYTQSVTVNITSMDDDAPNGGSGIYSVVFNYSTDGGQSWTDENVNTTLEYTIPAQAYDTNVTYYFIVTDEASNVATSTNYQYRVNDTTAPVISSVVKNVTSPEYDDDVLITATVSEPSTASGVNAVYLWTNATGSWISSIMTAGTSNTYTASILAQSYGTNISYYVKANDTENNTQTSSIYYYIVDDTVNPTISDVNRNATSPEYNESVLVWCSVTDHDAAAAGLDVVLLKYRNVTAGIFYDVEMSYDGVAGTWNGTIPKHAYGTQISYKIYANDTAGNYEETSLTSYTVTDTYAPVLGTIARDPSGTVTYTQTVTVNITAMDDDAPNGGS
ncbi:MAG: hypothetical protein ACTSRW_16475, partial [Candidatus Helarchaeota archaeon]